MPKFSHLFRFRQNSYLLAVVFPFVSAAAAAPLDRPGSQITWSTTEFEQTVYPGASTTVKEVFRSNKDLVRVEGRISGLAKDYVSIERSIFENVAAGSNVRIALGFRVPLGAPEGTVKGRLELFSKGAREDEALLLDSVPILIRIDPTVRQSFTLIADALESEDFDARLQHLFPKFFSPSQKERFRDILKKGDRESRLRHARVFREARLSYGTETTQTYTGPWKKGNTTTEVDFTLTRGEDGRWLITSW